MNRKKPTVLPPDAVVQSSGAGYADPLVVAVKAAISRSWLCGGVAAADLLREFPALTADALLAMVSNPSNDMTLIWHDDNHRAVYLGSPPPWPSWVLSQCRTDLGPCWPLGGRIQEQYAVRQGWIPVQVA